MSHPLKAQMKRRFEKVVDRVLDDYMLPDANDFTVPAQHRFRRATIIWGTKSSGQVIRKGEVLLNFTSQKQLVEWMEKAYKELMG